MAAAPRFVTDGDHWQTLWAIAGPKMPLKETFIAENIIIGPVAADKLERFSSDRPPVPKVSASSDLAITHYPPRDEIKSRFKLQIDIGAKNSDEAHERAKSIADTLLSSLSIVVPGGRYHAELRKIRIANADEEYSPYSETVTVSPLADPVEITDEEISRALFVSKAIDGDEIAQNAYMHLLTAWQLHTIPGSRPLHRSVLQHYILCIEAIVNGVMNSIRLDRADSIRLEERNYASQFAVELPGRSDKPKAIREASTKLRDISLTNFLPSIEAVAPILKLSESEVANAKDFYRFRSQKLSHPGRTKTDDFNKWLASGPTVGELSLADAMARTFFLSYCENLGS